MVNYEKTRTHRFTVNEIPSHDNSLNGKFKLPLGFMAAFDGDLPDGWEWTGEKVETQKGLLPVAKKIKHAP